MATAKVQIPAVIMAVGPTYSGKTMSVWQFISDPKNYHTNLRSCDFFNYGDETVWDKKFKAVLVVLPRPDVSAKFALGLGQFENNMMPPFHEIEVVAPEQNENFDIAFLAKVYQRLDVIRHHEFPNKKDPILIVFDDLPVSVSLSLRGLIENSLNWDRNHRNISMVFITHSFFVARNPLMRDLLEQSDALLFTKQVPQYTNYTLELVFRGSKHAVQNKLFLRKGVNYQPKWNKIINLTRITDPVGMFITRDQLYTYILIFNKHFKKRSVMRFSLFS